MGCSDYFKEIVANFFNSEAEKWVEENFKIVSIDKIMKVQFSIQLSNFAYYGQVGKNIIQFKSVIVVGPNGRVGQRAWRNRLGYHAGRKCWL